MNNNYNNINLNPCYISGFVDAEACFHISIVDNAELRTGKSVRAMFQIALHNKDKALLYLIQKYFGVGVIIQRNDGAYYYKVSQVKDLMIILTHFNKYPLVTQKAADLELFKQVVVIMNRREHLTAEGLQEIVNLKASMNRELLPDKLLSEFPKSGTVNRAIINPLIYDPE